MNKEKDIFLLGIKLALPLQDELENSILSYLDYIEKEAHFLPFVVYKLVFDYFNSGFLSYNKEIYENIFNKIEQKIFLIFYRSIDYLFESIEGDGLDKKPENFISIVNFINKEIAFEEINLLRLNFHEIPPPSELLKTSESFLPNKEVILTMEKYFGKWEELFFSKSFIDNLIIKYSVENEKLKETSKELIFAIRKFMKIIEEIYSYNFRLRKILGEVIVNHSNYRYPIGGYSEIARGIDEPDKLLYSELAYLDEDIGGIDLFTIKFIDRDLLFLVRDDNEFYGAGISFIFDLQYLRLFLKDKGEFIPEYFLILVFIISIVKIVQKEISDIRTYFLLKNVPKTIEEIVYYFIPNGINYEKAVKERKIPPGIKIYTVFNGEKDRDIRADVSMRVDIDVDNINIGNSGIRLFDKREVGKTLERSGDIIRTQIKNNYISSLIKFFRELG